MYLTLPYQGDLGRRNRVMISSIERTNLHLVWCAVLCIYPTTHVTGLLFVFGEIPQAVSCSIAVHQLFFIVELHETPRVVRASQGNIWVLIPLKPYQAGSDVAKLLKLSNISSGWPCQ